MATSFSGGKSRREPPTMVVSALKLISTLKGYSLIKSTYVFVIKNAI
jgi:hypothetical protein